MIPFKIDLTKNKINVEKYCDDILSKRCKKKINELEKWCKKYLINVGSKNKSFSFKDVIKAEPEELIEIKKHIDALPNGCNDELKTITVDKNGKKRERSYIVDTLYESLSGEKYKDIKLKMLKDLNIQVCPYCNRNYIMTINKIVTCQLDHYFNKSKYSILAVSYYNLIPSCSTCNRLKGTLDIPYYPYDSKYNIDSLRFTYDINSPDYLNNVDSISVKININDLKYKEQVEKILKLKEIYSCHNDIVYELIRKKQIFNDTYKNECLKEFRNLFKDLDDVDKTIYGIPVEKNEFGRRPLSKMQNDILSEL